jgi:hypothetical protein
VMALAGLFASRLVALRLCARTRSDPGPG